MKNFTTLMLLFFITFAFAQPNIAQPSEYIICDSDTDGFATVDLNTINSTILNELLPEAYSVAYFMSAANAEANIQPLSNIFTNTLPAQQTIYARVWEIADTNNIFIVPLTLTIIPLVTVVVDVDGFMVTVVSPAGEGYEYSLDGFSYQDNNIFANLAPGNYTIYIRNVHCGNVWQYAIAIVAPPYAPDTQPYIEGSTLADLEITGTSINWYADTEGTQPLPDTTPVVPGTTYYATQTINGTESQTYAITIMSVSSVTQQQAVKIVAYPNPTSNTITINSNVSLTYIELYNLQGQLVLSHPYRQTLNIQTLQSGIYLLKANGSTGSHTIKIIKE